MRTYWQRRGVVVIWAVAAALATPAAHAATREACLPPGSHLVAVHAGAVVYRHDGVLYGCLRRVHRSVALADVFTSFVGSSSAHHFTFAGDLLAFEYASLGKGGQGYRVQVFDLRTGQQLHDAPAGAVDIDGAAGTGPVTALVLSRAGDIGWIEATSAVNGPPAPYEVWRVTGRRSPPVRLDRGIAIAPASLRLYGQMLSWLDQGMTVTAHI
jgi:hypothetical protein